MFVKALQLHGFKSFADRTPLEFGPGITCVVGPNGSGKSNVVDALTWVMGVQGPRQLRGGSMEDVIFSGTPHRTAIGRADVELVLDNSDGRFPVEVAEVSIGRLLFRSGESRYTICGKPCRLVDIVELLSDAGVGRQMHNIVGQGRIDQILMSSPEERRVTIEEAAGVLKHRKRRQRALSRLESVEADLVRLEDVHKEVQRRLRPLRRQVEGAERHEEVSGLLRTLSLWRAGDLIRHRRRDERLARSRCEELDGRLGELRNQGEGVRSQLSALEVGAEEASEVVEAARALRERLDRVLAHLHGLSQVAAERRRSARRRLSELEVVADSGDLARQEEELRAALEALESEADTLAHESSLHAQVSSEHNAAVADLDASWRAAGLDGDDRRAALRAQHSSVEAALERAEAEEASLADRIDSMEDRLTRLQDAIAASTEEAERLQAESVSLEDRRQRLERLRVRAQEEHDRLTDHLTRLESEAAAQRARAESIEASAAACEASLTAAKRLRKRYGDLPAIDDLVRPRRGAERAVEAGLAELLSALLIRPELAAGAISTVKETPDGTLVLACEPETSAKAPDRRRIREAAEELGVLAFDEVVSVADSPHSTTIANLLSRISSRVFVARNAEHALGLSRAHPDLVFLTPDGDRFSGGLLSVVSGVRSTGVTLCPAEAVQRAELAERQAAAVRTRRVDREAEIQRLRREHDELASHISRSGAVLRSHAESLGRLADEEAELVRSLERARERRQQVGAALIEHRLRRDEIAARLAGDIGPSDDERQRLEGLRSTLDERGAALRAESLRIEAERARIAERHRAAEERLGEIDRLRKEAGERERVAEQQRTLCILALRHLDDVDDLLTAITAETVRRRDHAAAHLEACQAKRAETVRQLDALRVQSSRHEAAIRELDTELRDAQLAFAEAKARLEAVEEVPGRELGVSTDTALGVDLPEGVEPGEVEERIASAERELKRLGPVNPLALEEFRELSERNDLLESELEDVRTAKKDVLQIVRQVDRQIAEVLESAYADVGRHFSDLFALLFPGGEGKLIRTEPEDVLGTGIEIEARPSGKSPKRLSLLSGGERSLSALAFLFAVFRARPSPFYVLDEVEAALDDINLHRFCGLLREFRNDSQLIVVTHQKRTMETADVLLGVSLREDGTSRVLSQRVVDLDLTEAEASEAPLAEQH